MNEVQEAIVVDNEVAYLPHELTFVTVPEICIMSHQLIAQQAITTFDLVNVQQTDSAGLALLLDLLRFAQQQHKQLRFINMPTRMQAFAQVHGVDTFLF